MKLFRKLQSHFNDIRLDAIFACPTLIWRSKKIFKQQIRILPSFYSPLYHFFITLLITHFITLFITHHIFYMLKPLILHKKILQWYTISSSNYSFRCFPIFFQTKGLFNLSLQSIIPSASYFTTLQGFS